MGGAASKAAASAAPKTAAKAAASATKQSATVSGLRSDFSRSAVVVSHLDISNRDLNGASLVRNPNAPQKPVELMEMNHALLDDMKKFEDYEKVDYLVQNDGAFQDTASAYRERPSTPTALPQDRTAAASAAFGSEVVDHIPGRLTNRNLRELLRLHYEDPTAWSSAKLAEHFAMDVDVVRSILKSVGPADVLEPRAAAEFPFGVWVTSTDKMSKWQPFKPFKFADLLTPQQRQKLRELLLFTEASGTKQEFQAPSGHQKYRYPAPSNQPAARVPSTEKKENIYNTQYYTRDIRRMHVPLEVGVHPSIAVEKRAELPKDAKRGSPGNKNPAVLAYDPSGTRSAMTTTHEARDKLILTHTATHNIRFAWEGKDEEIIKEYESKNIPPVPGQPFEWDMPDRARIRRW
ncbi:hypothetical protein FI667_g16992, partial [Globisporangium splendens]